MYCFRLSWDCARADLKPNAERANSDSTAAELILLSSESEDVISLELQLPRACLQIAAGTSGQLLVLSRRRREEENWGNP
jgi:hypothetical protein